MIAWSKAKQFIQSRCRQSKEPWYGQPIRILDWQERFLQPFFDRPEVKTCSVWLPRKQGKSTIAAAVALVWLLAGKGEEVYIVAALQKQAEHLFRQIADYIDLDPELRNLRDSKTLWVRGNKLVIEYKPNKSILQVITTDPRRSGGNASLTICDEIAEWGCHAREVWDKITTGSIARPHGRILTLSTAQYNRQHVGKEIYDKCKAQLERPTDPTWLPVVYSLDEHDDPADPANWWKVNPSAGITVPKAEYYSAFAQTQDNPRELAKWCTFRLCQWSGSGDRWIAPNRWGDAKTDLKLEDFAGSEIIVGYDGSSKHDLTAYSILVERGGEWFLFPRFFIPADRADLKQKTDGVPYRAWAGAGHITLTPGERINQAAVLEQLLQDVKPFDVKAFVYDPYGMELFRQELEYKHGFQPIELAPTPTRLSPACGFFEREVLAKRLHHPNNPVMNWNLENVKVKTVQDRVYLEKAKMTQRIDGVSASLLAIWYLLQEEENVICGNPLVL